MADRTNRRVELSPLVAKRTVVDLKRTLSGKSVVISVDTIPQQTPTQSVRERRISSPRRKSEEARKAFGKQVAASVTKLKADPEAWQQYQDELNGMSDSLKDDLGEE